MISVNLAYNGYVGLSTDTKPIEDVNNGSRFYEMDTQKSYMFNAEGAEWIEQTAGGGGGGGSTGGGSVTYTATIDENLTKASFSAEDSAAIFEDAVAGKVVWLVLPEDEDNGIFEVRLMVTGTADTYIPIINVPVSSSFSTGAYVVSDGLLYDQTNQQYYVTLDFGD